MKKGKFKIAVLLACCLVLSLSLIACGPKTEYGTVSGKVLSAGEALEGVTVTIGDKTAETDEEGAYTLVDVEVKDATVKFTKTGYIDQQADLKAADFVKAEGAEKAAAELEDVIMVQKVTINGTVTSIGKPLEGASVTVTNAAGEEAAKLTTAADGKFSVADIAIDTYTVKVTKSGYGDGTKKLTPSNFRGGVATASISVAKYGVVAGKVLGEDGNGIAGVTVKFGDKTGETGADGAYKLEQVEVGPGSLSFTKTGYIQASKSLTINDFDNAAVTAQVADVTMKAEVLPGLSEAELEGLGAMTARAFRHTDSFKEAWKHYGSTNEHFEGYCLHANGDTASAQFTAYIYAKFELTKGVDDKVQVSARTFADQGSKYGSLGLMVVADGASKLVKPVGAEGDYAKVDADGYQTVTFDLSGIFAENETKKTVVIALGTNQGTHCAIDQVRLGDGNTALPFLTKEDLAKVEEFRDVKTFTGKDVYNKWQRMGGVKDLTEGSSIWNRTVDDTNALTDADMSAFYYARFVITDQTSLLTINAMTFEDQLTATGDHAAPTMYVKVVKADGTVATIGAPVKVDTTAAKTATYDLSAYVGETVTVAIGTASGWHCVLTNVAFGPQQEPAPAAVAAPALPEALAANER